MAPRPLTRAELIRTLRKYADKEDSRFKSPYKVLKSQIEGRREVRKFKSLRYKTSPQGRFFRGAVSQRSMLQQSLASAPIRGVRGGGRGRPRGSFDPRYARFGGVYGYRKALSAFYRNQRLQQVRQSTVTPQQEALLAQFNAQQQARQVNPENRTIPDTAGIVPLRSIHQEADDYANLVP